MNAEAVERHIVKWLADYARQAGQQGFVVGISGGIDSAVTSALCARTGMKVWLLEMPIYQAASQVSRAQRHMASLASQFPEVITQRVELTPVFDALMNALPPSENRELNELALANARARLRMTTLYYFAGMHRLLVAGTGNKVEDFGVGFFTKYGDGGVDLSPIADLTKTEVYKLGAHLQIDEEIMKAAPTDGLWGDDRTDEQQIGASYAELEWAMDFDTQSGASETIDQLQLSARQLEVLQIYRNRNRANRHKMEPIPVCVIPAELKD